MREAPELHWRWRGEAGPPVDGDLSNTIVVIAVVFSGLLFLYDLFAPHEISVLRLVASGGAVSLAGLVLVAAEVALLFRASARLMSGSVRLWTLTLPPALLWALGASISALQSALPRVSLDVVVQSRWVTAVERATAPQHAAALLGGAMLVPLLIVGVTAVAEGARRRRWALARRGGWLALSGIVGLLVMRWGWLWRFGLRRSKAHSYRLGVTDAAMVAVEAAQLSTAIAVAAVAALVACGLLLAWRRRAALPLTADGMPSGAMLVAPLLAWAALVACVPDVRGAYAESRRALLDERPAPPVLDVEAIEALRAADQASPVGRARRRGALTRVHPDEDAAAFAERMFLSGRADVLIDVTDIGAGSVARALAANMAPPLPRALSFPVGLHRGQAGAFVDLVLVFNSQGLKAPGDAPTTNVDALIADVLATRGEAGRIVVVPVAGRAGALLAELQRRGAAPGSPSWSIGRAIALLEEPCGCFIGPSPGKDPDTYLDARLCLDGSDVRGDVRWLSRNSGSNLRRVRGTVEGNAWTLHDAVVSAANAKDGWRFCMIDRYTLTQNDARHLVGTYVSEACDDRATLDLAPVECPDDVATATR